MVQSLERAFAILDEVARRPAGVTAIAERVHLPKTTVARLLATLEGARTPSSASRLALAHRPGGRPARRGRLARAQPGGDRTSVPRATSSSEVGEDAGLACPTATRSTTSTRSSPTTRCRCATGRAPARRCTRCPRGSCSLAEWPEEALDAYLADRPRRSHAAHGHRPRVSLGAAWLEVRAERWLWGRRSTRGIDSVAAPIRDSRGKPIAALHVHGPSYRFPPPATPTEARPWSRRSRRREPRARRNRLARAPSVRLGAAAGQSSGAPRRAASRRRPRVGRCRVWRTPSSSITVQNGQATASVSAPVAAASRTRSSLIWPPRSSIHMCAPPAPQQKVRLPLRAISSGSPIARHQLARIGEHVVVASQVAGVVVRDLGAPATARAVPRAPGSASSSEWWITS